MGDQHFVDLASREFEAAAPGISDYIRIGRPKRVEHIKNTETQFLSNQAAVRLLQSRQYSAALFHSIDDTTLPLMRELPEMVTIVWLGWGFDYYRRLLSKAYPTGLILPRTKQLLESTSGKSGLPIRAARAVRQLVRDAAKRRRERACLSRVDVFIPVLEIEYRLATKLNPWFRPDYVPWNYGTIEDDFRVADSVDEPLGRDVLVGNSASPENNHIDLFETLEHSVDLDSRRVVVPLSYGSAAYKAKVIEDGQRRFGERFFPLQDFMEKDAYLREIRRCGFVFMNHLRQQALGNICIALNQGARLFLNPRSPVCDWLRDIGVTFSDSTGADATGPDRRIELRDLPESERTHNRQAIIRHWGREAQRRKTRSLVEKLTDGAEESKGCAASRKQRGLE